jgi:protein-S-isoprenylcysteine O-methyltransferase Ste14
VDLPSYRVALFVAGVGAAARGVVVIGALMRTLRMRRQFVTFRVGWPELLVGFEPFALIVAAVACLRSMGAASLPAAGPVPAAVGGAALVVFGWAMVIWTFLSWPTIFTGHGVLTDHRLVTVGAYGVVRHPVYLGALLIWFGLALAYLNTTVFLIALLYVVPAYLLYIGSEERMMVEFFGETYREYARTVPRLIPRVRSARRKSARAA